MHGLSRTKNNTKPTQINGNWGKRKDSCADQILLQSNVKWGKLYFFTGFHKFFITSMQIAPSVYTFGWKMSHVNLIFGGVSCHTARHNEPWSFFIVFLFKVDKMIPKAISEDLSLYSYRRIRTVSMAKDCLRKRCNKTKSIQSHLIPDSRRQTWAVTQISRLPKPFLQAQWSKLARCT